MEMRDKILLSAAIAVSAAIPAHAQTITPAAGPSFAGTVTGSVSSTFSSGTSTTTQTGDSTTSPYQNTITTTYTGTLTSSNSGSTAGTVAFAGTTYGYVIVGTGSATQSATLSQSLISTFTPTTSGPVLSSTSTTSTGPTTSGTPTVSTLSVVGASGEQTIGDAGRVYYGGNLSSASTLNSNGTVNVTENTVGITTSGTTYSTYTGTASYNAGTGVITVGPLALASAASLSSTGLAVTNGTATSTYGATGLSTGTVTATTVNAGAVNATTVAVTGTSTSNGLTVGTPKLSTDATNKAYVDAAISGVNTSVNTLASLVEANRKRSDAGIATAVALSGGMFLPGKKVNVTANIGAFRDEVAIAGQLGILVSDSVAINAGISTSFHSYGGTSLRGGFTFGF
jgi:hypothetical protein